ncbi:MAG: NPCBM/NEW2 domain-containing protein, partial [Clostridia bacterium]|nr:NPCBM/NEW2 domain-containing protein [Clostridia bacterium]
MKKRLQGLITGILIGATITGGTVLAANTTTLYDVIANGIKIIVDGQTLNPTDVNGNKVEPIIYNGTTYLPVRAVANALGKAVYWDGPNYTVYLGDTDGKLEYPSAYLTENNIGVEFKNVYQHQLTDNYGNTYREGLYLYGNCTAEYLTNMKYSRLKGTLYIPNGITSSNVGQMKVVADGKLIYTSPKMDKTSRPVNFDINIRGYNHIKIEFGGYSLGFIG